MINWKSPIVLTALVVGVLLLAAAAGYVFLNPPYEVLPAQQATKIDISELKIYENKDWGFRLSYPSSWTLTDNFSKQSGLLPEDSTDITALLVSKGTGSKRPEIHLGINTLGHGAPTYAVIYKFAAKDGRMELLKREEQVIDPEDSFYIGPGVVSFEGVAIEDKGFEITGYNLDSQILQEEASSIVGSIEAINSQISLDTSTWQTYENKDLGFSFKYPSQLKVLSGDFNDQATQRREDYALLTTDQAQTTIGYDYESCINRDYFMAVRVLNEKYPSQRSKLEKSPPIDMKTETLQIGNLSGILTSYTIDKIGLSVGKRGEMVRVAYLLNPLKNQEVSIRDCTKPFNRTQFYQILSSFKF